MVKPIDKDVKQVYNSIAEGFYSTRQKNQHPVVPYLKKLAKAWKPGLLLDVGCGVGNSMLPFAKNGFECVGIDISPELIKFAKKLAQKNNVEFKLKTGNVLKLPFDDDKFDYVISVAVIHHLDSEKKRIKALEEIKRVLKPNGKLFISVWNKNQPRFSSSKKDIYVPWTHKGTVHKRYYHIFSKDELEKIVKKAGLKIVKLFVDNSGKNICVIGKNSIT